MKTDAHTHIHTWQGTLAPERACKKIFAQPVLLEAPCAARRARVADRVLPNTGWMAIAAGAVLDEAAPADDEDKAVCALEARAAARVTGPARAEPTLALPGVGLLPTAGGVAPGAARIDTAGASKDDQSRRARGCTRVLFGKQRARSASQGRDTATPATPATPRAS